MTSFKLNGKSMTVEADADTPLLWVIRDDAGLTGTLARWLARGAPPWASTTSTDIASLGSLARASAASTSGGRPDWASAALVGASRAQPVKAAERSKRRIGNMAQSLSAAQARPMTNLG